MKVWGIFIKKSRILRWWQNINQAQSPSEQGTLLNWALCNCTSHTPMKWPYYSAVPHLLVPGPSLLHCLPSLPFTLFSASSSSSALCFLLLLKTWCKNLSPNFLSLSFAPIFFLLRYRMEPPLNLVSSFFNVVSFFFEYTLRYSLHFACALEHGKCSEIIHHPDFLFQHFPHHCYNWFHHPPSRSPWVYAIFFVVVLFKYHDKFFSSIH